MKFKPQKPPLPARNNPVASQQQAEVVVTQQAEAMKVSSGPIPSPETLAHYEKVYPGLAKTIIVSFEAEYQKRHRLEELALNADIEAMRLDHADVKRGQWLGFFISMTGLVSAAFLIWSGHDVAGAALGSGSLAALVAAYFRNTPQATLPTRTNHQNNSN